MGQNNMMRKIYPSEHQIQCSIVEWANHTKIPANNCNIGDFLLAIPNGRKRHISEAIKLKKEGVKKGVCDMFFAYPSYPFSGLWMEIKSKSGKLSDDQLKWIELMTAVGFMAVVFNTVDDGIKEIKNYLGIK